MKRTRFVQVTAVLLTLVILAACSGGSSYPTKNINVIVPYGAGGTTDLTTRALLDAVDKSKMPGSTTFTVTNVAGGSGMVGVNQWINSKADGYTLGVIVCDLVLNRAMDATDITVEDNFTPIVRTQAEPYALIVKADSEINELGKFVEKAKAEPGAITIATTGAGTTGGLTVLALEEYFDTSFNVITYESAADCVVAVVSGEVDATISSTVSAVGQIEAGVLSIIGVTSNERSDALADVPAIGEAYPEAADLQMISWISLGALKDTDPEILGWLNDVLTEAVESDQFKAAIKDFYMQPANISPEENLRFCEEQYNYYMHILGK